MGFLNIEYKKTKYTFQSHSQNSIFIVNVIVESNHCPTLPALPQRQVFDCQTVPEQVGVSLVSWCGIKKKKKKSQHSLHLQSSTAVRTRSEVRAVCFLLILVILMVDPPWTSGCFIGVASWRNRFSFQVRNQEEDGGSVDCLCVCVCVLQST